MKKSWILTWFVITLLFAFTSPALSMPRFAAMVGQKCGLCHINPTGCGMRNIYGSQYFALTELPVHKTAPDDLGKYQPMVSDNISLGSDMRLLYIYNKDNKQSTFFHMEGNLYISANLGRGLSLTYSKDVASSDYDAYGQANVLPADGYIRVGKFQPSFGWRFADHTSFVRERMLWPVNYKDTGLELGIYPTDISANVGLFNGSISQFDENLGKAVAARFEFRKNVSEAGFGLGGSYWRNDIPGNATSMYGPFYYLNLFKSRLIVLGEIDWLKNDGTDIKSLATTQNLSFLIERGIWIEAQYDYHDPDVDLKSGTVARYSFSLDYFPIGFLELQPIIRFFKDDFASDKNYVVADAQFHFYF